MGKEKEAEGRKAIEEPSNDNKSQMIRVHSHSSSNDYSVGELLQRLAVAEELRGNRDMYPATIFESATESAIAKAAQEGLDLTCTMLLLGKTGVGKSATINSIFGKLMSPTDAIQRGTRKVEEFVGTVYGIKIRVIDTPGLDPSLTGYHHNKKVLQSVKHFIKKTPPDIVLYCDRLDIQSKDHEGDLSLMRTITRSFGRELWLKTIAVLTHGASATVADGIPLTFPMFVTQRSNVMRQQIRQAAGQMGLENPVVLVENHSALTPALTLFTTMFDNLKHVLENYSAQIWKAELLLLCLSSKITQGRAHITRPNLFSPLSYILSSLFDWRAQIKIPKAMDYELCVAKDYCDYLPLSYDSDNLRHRYLVDQIPTDCCFFAQNASYIDPNPWDHDVGLEGVTMETVNVSGKQTLLFSIDTVKDKSKFTIDMECSSSLKLGEHRWISGGVDISTVGEGFLYTLRGGSEFKNLENNTTTAGIGVTLVGNVVAAAMKVGNILMIGKGLEIALNGGLTAAGGDVLCGATLKANLKGNCEKSSIKESLSTLGLSLFHRKGHLELSSNLDSGFPLGQNTGMHVSTILNNTGSGRVKIGTKTSQHLYLVLIGIIPIFRYLQKRWRAERYY